MNEIPLKKNMNEIVNNKRKRELIISELENKEWIIKIILLYDCMQLELLNL